MQPPTLQNVRIQAAVAAVALLILAGVVWLGVVVERTRTELADMERSMAAISLSAASPTDAAKEEALARLSADVTALAAKIDALAADQTKNVGRQSAELKALAARIEAALAAAAAKSAQQAKTAQETKAPTAKQTRATGKAAHPSPGPEAGNPPQPPYYGPGYPAWPAY